MKSKRILSLLIALLMLCISIPANAEAFSLSASYNSENDTIVVSGTGSGVITIIMQADESPDSVSDDNLPIYYRAILAKDDYYNHTFALPTSVSGGTYYIRATASDGSTAAESVLLPSLSGNDEFIADINNASTAAALAKLMLDNAATLGIDSEDTFFAENTNKIAAIMLAFDTEYKSVKNFYYEYHKGYGIAMLAGADTAKIESTLNKYATYLELDYLDDFKNYEFSNEGSYTILCDKISKADFAKLIDADSEKKFRNVYDELVFLSEVDACANWQELKNILTKDYPDYIDCNGNDNYEDLKNPDKVFQLMYGTEYKTVDDIKDEFKDCASKAYDNENPKNTSTGGSRPSGGSSTINLPVQTETKDETTPDKKEFTDVKKDFWGYNAINALYNDDIINGYPDGSYKPQNTVTRAEFAKMIAGAFRLNAGDGTHPFTDTQNGAWYEEYIIAAYNAKIILGNENSEFNPNDTITREDACVMLNRAIKNYGLDLKAASLTFADKAQISFYAQSDISALFGNGIVKGVSETEFNPKAGITRAETAQLIYNALTYMKVI